MKAIILCGGLGTRLGRITHKSPKPLIQVAGRPFLAHVLNKLCFSEIDEFILATGYLADQVSGLIKTSWQDRPVKYSVEDRPLGTGGAIRLAMENYGLDQALIVNGDTFFDCDLRSMVTDFVDSLWATRMALRKVNDCSRYGRVQLAKDSRVIEFGEKRHPGPGLINAGVYVQSFAPLKTFGSDPFSFETDYLSKLDKRWPIEGKILDGYFVDIGIPEDLDRARHEMSRKL